MREQPVILRYEGDGQFIPASGFWASQCDKHFVVGDTYRMTEHYERSSASHSHFFAALNDAFASLPDHMRDEYPTVEHLRKKALIKKGYADERSVVCASKADAQRVAAFMKPLDDYAIIVPSEAVVRVWTAQSQSKKAMGAKAFQESKQAVLDFVDDLLGVARGETARQSGYQNEEPQSGVPTSEGSDGDAPQADTPDVAADNFESRTPAGEKIRSTQGGAMESSSATGQSPVEEDSPQSEPAAADQEGGDNPGEAAPPSDLPDLKRECIDKFLAAATDPSVPDAKDRQETVVFAKDAWKQSLPAEADFVKACFETARKVVKSELKVDAARRYLEGLI